ncbi:MAG: hypothetical protein IPI93_10400 [Sphingobacteriaceae bacterium]|nr:hypothetical protein [Sphingobacteriaceae bacterium]
MGKIHNYRFGSSSTYLPYFNDLETNINWSGKWDHTYIRSFPTILQLCNHSLKAFLVYRKIRSLRDIEFKNINCIDGNVLAYEFQKVVFDQNYVFVNYLWMRNHFSLCKHKTNIFFQDEFYPTGGRFISQAINRTNNKNMTSYGVQHGIIYEGHTVYNMTPVELECNKPFNGLPKPHKFILWGDFFKEVLNKNKAFADDELVVAGNLNYIVTAEKYKKLNNKNSVPGILWCTANDYLIKDQFDILKPLLASLTDYQLVIRFHPMLNIKDKLIEVIDKDIMNKVVFKNDNDIFDAIFKADIILAITASSIFMDALVLNKMVFQFKIDGHILSDFPNKNTLVIDSEEKLIQAYNDLLEGKYAKDQLSSQKLLHMSDGKWREILSV